MLRVVVMTVAAATFLANVAHVGAQTSCQPTIMQPCAQPPRADGTSSKLTASNKTDQSRSSRRGLSVGPDATLGLGPGARGLGLQQRF